MTAPDFANIEAKIRAEADTKMAAARDLAAARRTLLDARAEFATTDAANLKAVTAAEAAARDAGFDDKTLAEWNLTDTKNSSRPRRTTRGRASDKRARTTSRVPAAAPQAAVDDVPPTPQQ